VCVTIVSLSIPKFDVEDGVAYYIVNVGGSFNSWSVRKRYSAFEDMNNFLMAECAPKGLPKGAVFPPKELKLWQSHSDPHFLEKRRILLENYLKKLLTSKEISRSPTFLQFLTTDKHDAAPEQKSNELDVEEDDREVTGVAIPATRTMSDHILYQIDVSNSRQRKSFSKWTVLKRFGQFFDMDTELRLAFADDPAFLASLPAPPERRPKLFNDHMDPSFVEARRALLEAYLQKLISIPRAVRNPIVLKFLGVNV